MIADHDRSGWFGASDVRYIMGSWKGVSFDHWWEAKLGIRKSSFTNTAMLAGTMYEHPILEAAGVPEMDRQFLVPELLLRVNLDGNDSDTNYEVKTYWLAKGFKLPKHYRDQTQLQMRGSGFRKTVLLAYGLTDREYQNFFLPVDPNRILRFPIAYDAEWVETKAVPRIKYLAECLKEGRFPCGADIFKK